MADPGAPLALLDRPHNPEVAPGSEQSGGLASDFSAHRQHCQASTRDEGDREPGDATGATQIRSALATRLRSSPVLGELKGALKSCCGATAAGQDPAPVVPSALWPPVQAACANLIEWQLARRETRQLTADLEAAGGCHVPSFRIRVQGADLCAPAALLCDAFPWFETAVAWHRPPASPSSAALVACPSEGADDGEVTIDLCGEPCFTRDVLVALAAFAVDREWVAVAGDSIMDTLQAAVFLQCPPLVDALAALIGDNLDDDNAVSMFQLAETLGVGALQRVVRAHLVRTDASLSELSPAARKDIALFRILAQQFKFNVKTTDTTLEEMVCVMREMLLEQEENYAASFADNAHQPHPYVTEVLEQQRLKIEAFRAFINRQASLLEPEPPQDPAMTQQAFSL